MIEVLLRCDHEGCGRTLAVAWPDEHFLIGVHGGTIRLTLDGDIEFPHDGWRAEDRQGADHLLCPEHADA